MGGLVRFGNGLGVAATALVLLAAFVMQFAHNDLPCPLCNLQRVAYVLCGFGFLLNLRFGAQPLHYGVTLLAALFGLAASGRQMLLHFLPGDPGFGPPLMGLHLYTGTVVFFTAGVLGVARVLFLPMSGRVEPERLAGGRHAPPFGALARFVAWFLIAMTLANAVMSFALCGPIECPDNPTSYWLLQRLGR